MSSPHDALFKYVFSQPEHAASELRAVLPAELSMRIDWSSLELQPTSFVDARLSGRQADVLFTIRCQGRKTYLYVLLEHLCGALHKCSWTKPLARQIGVVPT